MFQLDKLNSKYCGWRIAVLFTWAAGIALRVYQSAPSMLGFDENLYRTYVNSVRKVGLFDYSDIVREYINYQATLPSSILPPLRFTYIFCGYLWTVLFNEQTLPALHHVACCFSILTLTLSFVFALRLGGRAAALGVLALVACAPTQIQMSQHALVDGLFTFWALLVVWSLWENLRAPGTNGWLILYAAALAIMVMTKENAFFVFVAVACTLLINRWVKIGTVTPRLVLATLIGPAIGVLLLVSLAGGPGNFIETYKLSVSKNLVHPYAIATGDGPWHHYLVDLLLVSPLVLILAIGELFKLRSDKKGEIYLFSFIGFSYLVMANVKYGMNLRYANMWDMPLRFLAFANLSNLASYFGKRRDLILALAVVGICAFDLHQYNVFFLRGGLYEMVSAGLLQASKILKPIK